MSTAFAIAATTAVLRSILETGLASANLGSDLGVPPVSALPPDRIPTGANEPNRLNLFMYQVTSNPGWRNVGLPSRNGNGDRVDDPPLAIDLHYLLSAYSQQDLLAEVLLGIGLHLLHEHPVLTRQRIRDALTPPVPDPLISRLATAELADQEELVKISPQTMTVEDISKLWSVFGEKYRPSAAFLATTVLIRGSARTSEGPPVRNYRIKVASLRSPTITSVDPQTVALVPNTRLKLSGHDLLAAETTVRFGSGAEQPPVAEESSPQTVVVVLPDSPPSALRAGVNTVQIVQHLHLDPDDGDPLHRGFESNVVPFVIRPAIKKRPANGGEEYDITLLDLQTSPAGLRSGTIQVKLAPDVARQQRVTLLLNETSSPETRMARRYTFDAPSRATETPLETDTIAFRVRGLVQGSYLLRIRVDGAETALDTDAQGAYVAPLVTIS